jgi:MFS family permease
LHENRRQFALLVVVNVFVGAMVGVERAILPVLAEEEFALASRTAILSFIATFGLAKALANLAAGLLGDRAGRRGVLITGWLVGLPVPFLLMWAPSWDWIVLANILLGLNQGLCWSSTLVMKVDLVGPRHRGLAVGLNEAAGYAAVSLAALASGYLAARYDLRPQPFYLGAGAAILGLGLSLGIRETRGFARAETGREAAAPLSFRDVFVRTSWGDRRLFALSQAGLVNMLADGLAWGLLPLLFAADGLSIARIGVLSAVYPAVWGTGQLVTGILSDRVGRAPLILAGMSLQAAAFAALVFAGTFPSMTGAMVLLGVGKALAYPTLIAGVSDLAQPAWRSTALGVYRLWRDSGYVVGALLTGVLADAFGLRSAVGAVACITLLSAFVASGPLRRAND